MDRKYYCGKVVNVDDYKYDTNIYEIPTGQKFGDRKIKDVLSYPHFPLSNRDLEPVYKPRKLIRSYTDTDLRNIPHRVQDNLREKLSNFRSKFSLKESNEIINNQVKQLQKYREKTAKQLKVSSQYKSKKSESYTESFIKNKHSKVDKNTSVMPKYEEYYDPDIDQKVHWSLKKLKKHMRGKSSDAIKNVLLRDVEDNITKGVEFQQMDINAFQEHQAVKQTRKTYTLVDSTMTKDIEENVMKPLEALRTQLKSFSQKESSYIESRSKQTSIEIEQLNARVVEAETKLRSEVARIKKKLQIQITELEMSLDVANKTNIDLQKTIKKQSITLTELQAHYDEVQRQLQVTLDQLGISQRKVQALTAECEDIRGNYETALRGKRSAELQYEEAASRINELTTINVNIQSAKIKIEQELSSIASEYDEITKELRISDERYQRVQTELKHTVEILHEEQERIVKIEAIKKSLEIEVKNLSVRLEEVEANAIVGGKRIISKLEARLRDLELELDEEKRRHAETIKILRKKERQVKECVIQCEEDQKNIALLQETLDKTTQKVSIYKRQLQEQEGVSQQSVTRVRRFQRELEAAEDRADVAESNLSLVRAKHRTFVTTSSVPGSQVYLVQETRTTTSEM